MMGLAGLFAQQLSLAEDVDLDTVAAVTDGFSAADLQAVCSDAQLESVHSFLAKKEAMTSADSTAKPVITMQNLQTAARNARPSVPETERKKLNDVYASFTASRKTASSKVCRWYFLKVLECAACGILLTKKHHLELH
jgi:peroxin-1